MNSLFLRLLVALWLAMMLLGGTFAVIHAWTFPTEPSERWRRLSSRTTELRALQALDCARSGGERCTEPLEPIDERDPRIAIFKDGELVLGEAIDGAAAIEQAARVSKSRATATDARRDLVALYVDKGAGGPYVFVSTQLKPSPWAPFLVPEALPWRLLAIAVVTGLVSLVLARALSRPVRTLRAATQKLAEGDMSVRVAPDLRGADRETLALGLELDRMAARIESLRDAERRLLRDVSHELRSPLARLNLALELLRRKTPPEAEAQLARIDRESQRLDAIVGELLSLSRLEAGAGLERTERVEIDELVRAIVDDVAFEAEQKGARVALAEHGAQISVQGNEELLRRAIENVLRNAVRFTKEGSSVELAIDRDGDVAKLTVRDHGPGVPEAALTDIFRPFYRVEDDRARTTGGTGIGLAIAERALRLHGGSIKAENARDGGLVVSMQLPVAVG